MAGEVAEARKTLAYMESERSAALSAADDAWAENQQAMEEAATSEKAAEASQAKEADAERHEQKLQEEELAAREQAQAGDAHGKEIEQQAAAKVAEIDTVRVAMQSQHTSDLKQAAAARQEAEQAHKSEQEAIRQNVVHGDNEEIPSSFSRNGGGPLNVNTNGFLLPM